MDEETELSLGSPISSCSSEDLATPHVRLQEPLRYTRFVGLDAAFRRCRIC